MLAQLDNQTDIFWKFYLPADALWSLKTVGGVLTYTTGCWSVIILSQKCQGIINLDIWNYNIVTNWRNIAYLCRAHSVSWYNQSFDISVSYNYIRAWLFRTYRSEYQLLFFHSKLYWSLNCLSFYFTCHIYLQKCEKFYWSMNA